MELPHIEDFVVIIHDEDEDGNKPLVGGFGPSLCLFVGIFESLPEGQGRHNRRMPPPTVLPTQCGAEFCAPSLGHKILAALLTADGDHTPSRQVLECHTKCNDRAILAWGMSS